MSYELAAMGATYRIQHKCDIKEGCDHSLYIIYMYSIWYLYDSNNAVKTEDARRKSPYAIEMRITDTLQQ